MGSNDIGLDRGQLGGSRSAEAVTVRQGQSLVALPDDGYTPRPCDPRAGYGSVSYVDGIVTLTGALLRVLP